MGLPFFLEQGYQAGPELPERVTLIPVPFADTVSYLAGTDEGPAAILKASSALELFDDELLLEPWQAGITTLPPLAGMKGSENMLCSVCETVDAVLKGEGLPIVLGGEHSISIGAVAACLRHYPDLYVIQVDAHLDLRDRFDGNTLSHACVMRRLDDLGVDFIQVGIRSFSREEWQLCKARNWRPWTMNRLRQNDGWQEEIRQVIQGRPIYLSFDVDGLDPSIMPATGTPEPDGLTWHQATGLVAGVIRSNHLVGCDFVELAPAVGPAYSSFTVAKLVYRTIGYWWQRHLHQG